MQTIYNVSGDTCYIVSVCFFFLAQRMLYVNLLDTRLRPTALKPLSKCVGLRSPFIYRLYLLLSLSLLYFSLAVAGTQ